MVEYNQSDHIGSRIPQASNKDIFFSLTDNPRVGEIHAYVNLYADPELVCPVVGVVPSNLHALYPIALEHAQNEFFDYAKKTPRLKSILDYLPKVPEITAIIDDVELDMINDWQVSIRDSDRAVSIGYNTQGGTIVTGKQIGRAHV